MGSVYKRGPFWWLAFKLPGGQRVMRSSGVSSALPEREALKVLVAVEKELATQGHREASSKLTVAEWAGTWTASRRAAKQTNARKDFARLELHVLPVIGGRRIGAVGPAEVRKLVAQLRAKELAPRTIINTYGLVRRLFLDALAEELIVATPCVLKRRDLPKKRDKSPTWRAGAVFTREEAEKLLASGAIPLDRRVTYALGLCAGMREGEIAALKWESLDLEVRPLPRLLVAASFTRANGYEKSTKTESPRQVPVHPVLGRVLEQWRAKGFAATFGREPRPGDLLVPNRHGGYRTDNTFLAGLARDLAELGLRHRRMHDTRRTFVSLGRTDGANPAVLKSLTHDQVGDQFDQYTTFSWEAQCEAVSALALTGRIMKSATSKVAGGAVATRIATREAHTMQSQRNQSGKRDGQGGTRSLLRGDAHAPQRVVSGDYPASGGRSGSLKSVPRSNVANRAIATELDEARRDFEVGGDRSRLATRLRLLLALVRK
jgi:integrase